MKLWPSIFRTLPWGIIQPYSGIYRTLCHTCICRNLAYSVSWNIQNFSIIAFRSIQNPVKFTNNLRIFRTLTYLKPDTYSEPSQRFKMEFLVILVKNYNYFYEALHLKSFIGFWIRVSLNKVLINLSSDLTLWIIWYIFRTVSIIVNSDIFRHI